MKILHLAARDSEAEVDGALKVLIDEGQAISFEAVEAMISAHAPTSSPTDITVEEVDLSIYDLLQ